MKKEEQKFSGVSAKARQLLVENRIQDSKPFYEAHKAQLNALAIEPMRLLAAELGGNMLEIDEKMNLIPSRMVSRLRRDTRFTHDQTLYRAHVWVMFMRPKKEWPNAPAFWFEVKPAEYTYGVGYYDTSPRLMEAYRQTVREDPGEFRRAAYAALDAGFVFPGDAYKREKEGDIPPDLRPYYNLKDMTLWKRSDCLKATESAAIVEELRQGYRILTPMYHFLMRASDILTAGSN